MSDIKISLACMCFLLTFFFAVFVMVVVCQAMVSAAEDRGLCYGLGSGTIAGIIFADVAVTVLIVSVTYWYASKRRQKKENADKVYMNVRANCKA